MSVTIGSRRRGDRGRDGAETVYCGRPSALGNPHPVGRTCPICRVPHTREDAIALYDLWLTARLASDTRQRRAFDVLLRALAEGRDLLLVCHCRSEPRGETGPACHADVIRRLLAERAALRGRR
jgi:hypothetical protein